MSQMFDKFVYLKMQPGSLLTIHNEQQIALSEMDKIQIPLLMLIASNDVAVNNEVAKEAFARVKSTNKQLIEYPEFDHFMTALDEDYQIVQADALKWLLTQSICKLLKILE